MKALARIVWAVSLGLGAWAAAWAEPQEPRETQVEEGLILRAVWAPIAESKYRLHETSPSLASALEGLPATKERSYRFESFAGLIPTPGRSLGDTWAIDPALFLPFLRQLHPGASTELHHGDTAAPGAQGCLVARSDTRIEVLFRMHAEFLLQPGIFFTPAQFEGRMIYDRATRRVLEFALALPPRNTNVDLNAFDEQTNGLFADIAFVPKLELASAPLALAALWKEQIPIEDARDRLKRAFYPSAKIDWLPLGRALQRSAALKRPLHVVILFGTLDDESC